MYPTATDGTLPNNRQFSSCSRDVMGRTIVNNGDCFVESNLMVYNNTINCYIVGPYSQVCGNSIVEGTEECDCGSNATCKANDPCCKVGECLLEEFAQCR